MSAAQVTVSIDREVLRELDRRVARGEFPNRSKAMEAAVTRLLGEEQRRQSLVAALAKLDPREERALAQERLVAEEPWPRY